MYKWQSAGDEAERRGGAGAGAGHEVAVAPVRGCRRRQGIRHARHIINPEHITLTLPAPRYPAQTKNYPTIPDTCQRNLD